MIFSSCCFTMGPFIFKNFTSILFLIIFIDHSIAGLTTFYGDDAPGDRASYTPLGSPLSLPALLKLNTVRYQDCPNIITKEQWGSIATKETNNLSDTPEYVIIAHTATPICTSITTCSQKVASIQEYHTKERNFDDIAYNFLIGDDGNVYEGRGWNKAGSHTRKWNSKSLGIAFIGEFTDKLPSQKALDTLEKLLECGVEKNKIDKNYKLLGHRQVMATISPGKRLFEKLKSFPHFSETI